MRTFSQKLLNAFLPLQYTRWINSNNRKRSGKQRFEILQHFRLFRYFGVIVPLVRWCCATTKKRMISWPNLLINLSFFHLVFLIDSPVNSIRWEECTIRSKIASAIVPSPIVSCQFFTGIWAAMIIDDLSYFSSTISIRAFLAGSSKAVKIDTDWPPTITNI